MTRLRIAPLLFLFLALPAFGAKVAINGRVAGPGGAPVAEARVFLIPVVSSFEAGRLELLGRAEPEPAATVRTDKAGAFQLTAEPGMWKAVVAAEGFVPLEHLFTPLVDAVELPAAELRPDRRLEVRVTGPGGKPLAGARVKAEPEDGTLDRSRPWQPARRLATTDSWGIATLPRAADEKLAVRAAAPDLPLAERNLVRTGTVTLALVPGLPRPLVVRDAAGKGIAGVLVRLEKGFWPVGLTDTTGALSLSAPAAGKIEVRLRSEDGRWASAHVTPPAPEKKEPQAILLPPPSTAAGHVVSATDGRPVPGALAWLAGDPGTFTRAGTDGSYRLPIPPGPEARVSGTAGGYFEEWANVRQGEPRVPTLALTPKLSASGVVVDEKGAGVPGVEITAAFVPGAMRSSFRSALFGSGGLTRTNAAGRFRLGSLFAGTGYLLRVAKPGFAPARAELPAQEPGQPAAELRIVLRTGRTGFGLVQDRGRVPVAGASVTLRPAASADLVTRMREAREPGLAGAVEGTTDTAGRFELANLPAGTYDLTVKGHGFAPLTVPGLVIADGTGATDLGTLMLAPGVSQRGLVTDPSSRPVEGAEVRARKAGGDAGPAFLRSLDSAPADAFTAVDGTFVLEDRAPGEVLDLSASHPDYASGSAPGVVVPAEAPVRLVLQPTARVAGRAAGPDGRPVPGASVSLREMVAQNMAGHSMMTTGRFHQAQADDEGAFRFEGIAPGPIELTARAPRRQEAELNGIEVRAGQELTGLELVLAPGSTVAGRVLAPDGRPVPGAQVSLQTSGPGEMFSFPRLYAHTDGDGAFTLDGVPPGPRTLAAEAETFQRTVRDLDVKEGENALDFTLGRGAEVSGRVVDESGAGVAGVRLTLTEGGNFIDAPEAASGADGAFRFSAVPDGTFRLSAMKTGYAWDAGAPATVTVAAGASVSGLEVKLASGGSLTGKLSGLAFDQLSRVRVWANTEFTPGRVDSEGMYRFSNLRPGEWLVVAEVPGTSLRAEGKVKIEAGVPEARLDLLFGDGFELSGRVLRNGTPAPGLVVTLAHPETPMPLYKEADHQGSFRFGGLKAGSYEVAVSDAAGGTLHEETVELTGDREIRLDLRTASLSGRVTDAAGTGPLQGATVSLVKPGEVRGLDPGTQTDSRGAFRFGSVGEGTWTLRATRDGYAPAEREVSVEGAPIEGLDLALQATEGLTLEVLLPSGQAPVRIRAAALAADGRAVAQGSYPVGENGLVRLSDVPAGTWQLVVESDQSAPVTLTATAPGSAGRALLPQGGDLHLTIPGAASAGATVTLTAADGTPFRVVRWEGLKSSWETRGTSLNFDRVPAGTWKVTAQVPGGSSWSGNATITPGGVTKLSLE